MFPSFRDLERFALCASVIGPRFIPRVASENSRLINEYWPAVRIWRCWLLLVLLNEFNAHCIFLVLRARSPFLLTDAGI
jgi:hypothetical protein